MIISNCIITIAQCHEKNPQNSLQRPSSQISYGYGFMISALGALGELTLGLPLDRIKTALQAGEPCKNIKLSSLYAGHIPSVINRCFIYLPGIQMLNYHFTKNKDLEGNMSRCIEYAKSFIIAGMLSPYVSFFEGLKTAQQRGPNIVYPGYNLSQNATMTEIIRTVTKHNNCRALFAGIIPTFMRESAFISGMCVIEPKITDMTGNRVLGSLAASMICQTLSQPLDVLKTRCELVPSTTVYENVICLIKDMKKGNLQIVFAGWLPRTIRGIWTFMCMSYVRDLATVPFILNYNPTPDGH